MNEITAAIKKKAEEKYPDNPNECLSEYGDRMRDQICYTCGGEDAIGFMLKFVEWTQKNYWETDDDGFWYKWCLRTPETDKLSLTTEQLLLKYMEENKL